MIANTQRPDDDDYELVAGSNPAYHTTLQFQNPQQRSPSPDEDVHVYETIPGDTSDIHP